MNEQQNTQNGEFAKPQGFLARLDNFWYHYKWHSIIALFLIFTITVCSLQMCQKQSFDVYILYAGSHEIERQSSTADMPEYQKDKSAFSRVTDDFNKDGKTSLSLKDLFILTSEEIKEVEDRDDGTEVNYSLLSQNTEILQDTMVYSSYYLCLLSPSVYEEYNDYKEVKMFASLSQFVNDGTEVSYYAEDAVYLSSTGFYSLPGISELPEDTLICLRNISDYTSYMNKKEATREHGNAKEVLIKILNYKK